MQRKHICTFNESEAHFASLGYLWSLLFSHTMSSLAAFTVNSHWLVRIFSFPLIGSLGFFRSLWLTRWEVSVYSDWLLWILWFWFLCPIQVPFYLRNLNGTRGVFLTNQTWFFFWFFVSPLSVKHSDKLISGFFRMWKCCLSMEKWSQNGIKYLIASESLKGTSTCQVLSQCLPCHIFTKGGGKGGRGLKNTRPLSKPTPLLPRQRRSWGLAFVTRIRTPDPRISSSSFEERTQLCHLSWFRDPHCAFLISDPARRLSQVNLLHDRAHQPLFFSWLTQNQTANVLVQPFLLALQHIHLFAHEKFWGLKQSKLAGEWFARGLFHY